MYRARCSKCSERTVDDGFGNIWSKCDKPDCELHVVRPGKVQCDRCDFREAEHIASLQEKLRKLTPEGANMPTMSKQTHTPGPWRVVVNKFHCEVMRHDIMTSPGNPEGDHPICHVGPEEQANARLIAAAPDLLEALKECVRVLCHVERFDPSVDKAIQKATHAIAKAEGK